MFIKPIVLAYKLHYSRAERVWTVSTEKGLTPLYRLKTKFYYVDKKPYKYLRDAISAVLIRDGVL